MAPKSAQQFNAIRTTRRKIIIETALKMFAKHGYHSTSISQISKEAGISKGLMYNYFESKEELLRLLIGSLMDQEMAAMGELFKGHFTEEKFIDLIKSTTTILKNSPEQWKLYYTMATQPEVLQVVQEKFTPERLLFAEKLQQFFKDQGVKDPLEMVHYFTMVLTGFKVSYIHSPNNFPIDEMEKRLINQFINPKL